MKKNLKKICGVVFACALFLTGIGIMPEQTKAADAPSNETMEGATPIELGGRVSCTFNDKYREAHYFKFVVPQNIGNKWITFTVTNYTDGPMSAAILDLQGNDIGDTYKEWIREQTTYSIETRIQGADTRLDGTRILIPGNTYYIKATDSNREGNVTVSVAGTTDDNWGTYDKADPITVGSWKNGKIEKNDDVDCFSVILPNDNRKHTFNVTSSSQIKASFVNGNRVLLSEVSVDANTTNNTYSVTGKGQRIYVRVQAGNNDVESANYSIKVSIEKKTFSKLSLSSYKKKKKKITGTTIKNAAVKVKVAKKTYTVKSSAKTGKFTVKLKKKLKSKDKIKVSVSKTEYKTLTKTFVVI